MRSDQVDLHDLQGNIVRGYNKPRVRHLVVGVRDPAAARAWIARAASGGDADVPAVTSGEPWDEKPEWCFNIGVTAPGLSALGLPDDDLATFPASFRNGMAARAIELGDVGPSDPTHWVSPWNEPGRVHLVATIHADTGSHLDEVTARIVAGRGATAFEQLGAHDGANFDGDQVHFGYRDNISQPRYEGISKDIDDPQPFSPLGSVLLGHPTALEGLVWRIPQPEVLGRNGTFNAFRVLMQDTAGFESYLDDAADELDHHPLVDQLLPARAVEHFGGRREALREVVAAKMCGRWRTGTPLELSPDDPAPDPARSDTDFDYLEDESGLRCPVGAHTRRCNPRGGKIVQRVANHTRRIVRRGIPYGPAHDPANPNDGIERGLLGNFLCANLASQFEAVQYDWLNLGLQHPDVTGSNDPLLGSNEVDHSWFDIPVAGGTIRLRGFPRFVVTRGGGYTFLPSMSGLRHLGGLPG